MKKYFWLIAVTTLCLFFIGLFISPFLLKWTEMLIGKATISLLLSDFLVPRVSFGLLLAFCAICAGCLLWAYLKNNFLYDPKLVFGLGLVVSFITAAIGIGSKLLQFRFALSVMGNELDGVPVAAEAVNYFSWGFGLTLLVNTIAIVILLSLSRQRQGQKDNPLSVSNN